MTSTSRVSGEARAHTARAVLSPAPPGHPLKRYVELKKANPDLPIPNPRVLRCAAQALGPLRWRGTQGTRDPGGEQRFERERAAQGHTETYTGTGTQTSALLLILLQMKYTFAELQSVCIQVTGGDRPCPA